METVDMRKELHECIDNSDTKFIKVLYELIKEYQQEGYLLTEEEMKDFEQRKEKRLEYKRWRLIMDEREQYLKGQGQTHTWDEVKQSILSGKRL